jgi:lipopolysaccharide export system permease protein
VKPRILYHYIFRGLALNWLAMLALLTAVMSAGQLPAILSRAAEYEIAPNLILQVLAWMTIANAPLVILVTIMIAIVVTLGRLASDSELVAMSAAGFAPRNLLWAALLLAIPVLVLQAMITLRYAPDAFCQVVLARAQAARNIALAPIRPGRFLPVADGRTLYVERVGADGELRNIFAASQRDGNVETVTATRGRVVADPAHDRMWLELTDGERHSGKPGTRKFRVVRFRELRIGIVLPAGTTHCSRPDARASSELWNSREAPERAELHSRLGYIVMTAVLTLVAVALSKSRPRTGAYAQLPLALAIFAAYQFSAAGLTSWSSRTPSAGPWAYWSLHLLAAAGACAGLMQGSQPIFRRGQPRARPQ